jgi:DNA-binding CsgD family transcriptional regulator
LKKLRVVSKLTPNQNQAHADESNCIVFYEKPTGLAHIREVADASQDEALERLASALAMQCLVRGSEPSDVAILVPAEKTLANRLASRAQELLEEGRAFAIPVPLSPRQREILHAVIHNRTNKEIASELNITVRTVKFHVSSLLAKFDVQDRSELAQRAAGYMRLAIVENTRTDVEVPTEVSPRRELKTVAPNDAKKVLRIAPGAQGVRCATPILPA